jgi:hypothetical protein
VSNWELVWVVSLWQVSVSGILYTQISLDGTVQLGVPMLGKRHYDQVRFSCIAIEGVEVKLIRVFPQTNAKLRFM